MLNVGFHKSTDGGKTWTRRSARRTATTTTCGSRPTIRQRMIEANDGGANVSVNGGETWTDQDMPTAQFYHVITTGRRAVPRLRRAAGQLDGVRVEPRAAGRSWRIAAAAPTACSTRSAAARAATSPRSANPDIFYAGSYGGLITRFDRQDRTGARDQPVSGQPDGLRVERTSPSASSGRSRSCSAPTDPNVLYVGSQHLWKTTNEGQAWTKISPDLTRHDPKTMGASGGPITKDEHRRRDLRDDLHDRAVAEGREPHLDRLRRRLRARDARRRTRTGRTSRRQDLPRLRAHQPHRGVAVPAGHRVRRRQPLSARRLRAVRLPDRRLRQDVDEDRRPASRRTTSRAPFARTRSARSCCTSAPSTASTCRSTTARTGSRCG